MREPNNNGNGRHILIVDDEPLVRRSLSELLTLAGYSVSSASNGKEAMTCLNDYHVDIIISDIKMPEMDGTQLLKKVKSEHPDLPVILTTGYGSIENAVDAMRQGAYDYVTKPIVDSEIKIIIERIFKQQSLQEENVKLKEELHASVKERFLNIVGKDSKMQKIYAVIEAISTARANVLIHGESGTGKRLIAHAIHKYNEQERDKPFVEVSCGALSETLLESELFGHAKGSFTGAIKDRIGRFELADGGSIFLDEIDAFSPALQVKLLRVLQEGEFERVGETATRKVDVRVIAATNQNLQELITQNKFRKDLFYRLNIISIEVPPLRERKGDIPALIADFIHKHSQHIRKKIDGVSDEALSMLLAYNWPGNIRELENVIERAIILCKGPLIGTHDFPEALCSCVAKAGAAQGQAEAQNLKEALKSPEKDIIIRALDSANWNRNEVAKKLGINRTTLYKKMRKYGLLKRRKGATDERA